FGRNAALSANPAAIREIALSADRPRLASEEIAIERQHHIRLREIVNGMNRFAERLAAAFPGGIAAARLATDPSRLGESVEQIAAKRRQSRRRRSPRQDANAGALPLPL